MTAGLMLLLSLAPFAGAAQWIDSVSAHFVIRRQTAFSIGASAIDLERLHNRLRLDLASFSPWMANERITLYLYPDAKSYGAGEFHPPSWSNGMAFYDRRIIAVYAHRDPEALDKIIAHEMTHLLFESYWAEAGKMPPSWLNEGLAMLEETERSDEESKSEWYQGMASLGPNRIVSLDVLTRIDPSAQLQSKDAASYWYVSAYSMVDFLYRQHSKLQFINFCKDLRDGRTLQDALWRNYRYSSPGKFEVAWKTWLGEVSAKHLGPRARLRSRQTSSDEKAEEKSGDQADDASADGKPKLKPVDMGDMSFHNFRDGR